MISISENMIDELKTEVNKLIRKNKIEEALNQLDASLKSSSPKRNELTHLFRRFNSINDDILVGR